MQTSNLLIVDDHRVFCQGLETVFAAEPDFEPMAISDPVLRSCYDPDSGSMPVDLVF